MVNSRKQCRKSEKAKRSDADSKLVDWYKFHAILVFRRGVKNYSYCYEHMYVWMGRTMELDSPELFVYCYVNHVRTLFDVVAHHICKVCHTLRDKSAPA